MTSQTTVHFPHLKQTNFSCRHNPDILIKRVDASDVDNGEYQLGINIYSLCTNRTFRLYPVLTILLKLILRVPCKRKLLRSNDHFNDSNHFNLSIPRREYTDGMGSESPDGWGSCLLCSPLYSSINI